MAPPRTRAQKEAAGEKPPDEAPAEVEQAPEGDALAHLSIYERLGRIVAELPAIGKGQRNEQQGFMFRGHDDVMNELNPLLSKYGVFLVPDVIDRVTAQRATSRGGVMYEVNLHVRYTFYGPRGDSLSASAWGEGTDSGDKSTNKAMTMAFKNVIAQTFAVSTQENSRYDTDAHTDEPTQGRVTERYVERQRSGNPAPRSWKEWREQAEAIDANGGWQFWLDQVCDEVYGSTFAQLPSPIRSDDVWKGACRTLANLHDTMGGRELPPPTRDEVRDAFMRGFALGPVGEGGPYDPANPGDLLEGPPWAMDAQEVKDGRMLAADWLAANTDTDPAAASE